MGFPANSILPPVLLWHHICRTPVPGVPSGKRPGVLERVARFQCFRSFQSFRRLLVVSGISGLSDVSGVLSVSGVFDVSVAFIVSDVFRESLLLTAILGTGFVEASYPFSRESLLTL